VQLTTDGSGRARLAAFHVDDPAAAIVRTPARGPFLELADADLVVRDSRGHVRVHPRVHERLRDQVVDTFRSLPDGAVLVAGTFREDARVRWELRLQATDDGQLRFTTSASRPGAAAPNRTTLRLESSRDEQFHGFGMQASLGDFKGHRVPVVASEQGIGRGRQPLTAIANALLGVGGDATMGYATLPQYVTSRNRSTFLENVEVSEFDLRSPDSVAISVQSGSMRGRFLHGHSPKELVEAYTRYAGRPRALPEWLGSGAIVGVQGGTDAVRGVVERLRGAGAALAGVWLQDWTGTRSTPVAEQLWWNWELDRTLYPGWDRMRTDLAAEGARVLTYVNPMLVDVDGRPGVRRNLYREALERGYLVRRSDGSLAEVPNTTFSAGIVDLSNPQARRWYRAVIAGHVRETGSSGFMADYGEALPFDAAMHDGSTGADWHNRYADEWARLVREALDEAGMTDVVAFHRSGSSSEGARGQAALQWTGDQLVTWDRHDGMRSALTSMLNGGFSGFALSHADTGGYTTIPVPVIGARRSGELLRRWTELSTFTPMLRTHEGSSPGANAQVWSDDRTIEHFARMSRLFASLAPYRRSVVDEAARTGVPAMRHMWMEFPEDPATGSLDGQFMLGSSLLVAPVLRPGASRVRVYLPAGEWVHLLTGERFGSPSSGGRWETVAAPEGTPAAFYPAASRDGRALGDAARRALAGRRPPASSPERGIAPVPALSAEVPGRSRDA
jgi:alpha-glucosidase